MTYKNKKKVLKYLGGAVLVLLVVVVSSFFWLYKSPLTENKVKIFKSFPLPIAFIGGKAVFINDFLLPYQLAKNVATVNGGASDTEIRNSIFEQILNNKKVQALADKENISISGDEINEEYARRKAQDPVNFEKTNSEYGLSEKTLKEQILKPYLLLNKLSFWFVNQRSLNTSTYNLADSLLKDIQNGQSLESLAKSFSEDEKTKAFEGDLGFVGASELVPEIRDNLKDLQPGKTKMLASRYGVHIFQVVEKDNNGAQGAERIHLKQIYLKPANFAEWFDNETANIKVHKLITI